MSLMLNDILHLTKEEVKNSKIELNMRENKGTTDFIDLYVDAPLEEKIAGTCEFFSYWPWYGNKRNFLPGQNVFSFVRKTGDEWLFVSAAKIIETPEKQRAVYEVLERFQPLFGRLVVNIKKGNAYARYTFNLSKYLDTAYVKEILPSVYTGEEFAGYDSVYLDFSDYRKILEGKKMPTYFEALSKVTGVYCLTDKNTGKLYIGSAYGEGGVARRWGNYFNKNMPGGGNKKLIELYEKKGIEYFEKYFTFTLLEYFGRYYDPEKIIKREQYWKKRLKTREFGYNSN